MKGLSDILRFLGRIIENETRLIVDLLMLESIRDTSIDWFSREVLFNVSKVQETDSLFLMSRVQEPKVPAKSCRTGEWNCSWTILCFSESIFTSYMWSVIWSSLKAVLNHGDWEKLHDSQQCRNSHTVTQRFLMYSLRFLPVVFIFIVLYHSVKQRFLFWLLRTCHPFIELYVQKLC